jgi:hypothetical protein
MLSGRAGGRGLAVSGQPQRSGRCPAGLFPAAAAQQRLLAAAQGGAGGAALGGGRRGAGDNAEAIGGGHRFVAAVPPNAASAASSSNGLMNLAQQSQQQQQQQKAGSKAEAVPMMAAISADASAPSPPPSEASAGTDIDMADVSGYWDLLVNPDTEATIGGRCGGAWRLPVASLFARGLVLGGEQAAAATCAPATCITQRCACSPITPCPQRAPRARRTPRCCGARAT